MGRYFLEAMPIPVICLCIVLLLLAACEAGTLIGCHHHRTRQDEGAMTSVGPMAGGLPGMLAFILVFTSDTATSGWCWIRTCRRRRPLAASAITLGASVLFSASVVPSAARLRTNHTIGPAPRVGVRAGVRSPAAFALAVLVCASSGCVLGPNYARPTVEAPQTYRFATVAEPASTLVPVPAWWRSFGDRELDVLVAEGLAANHDLRIATARVDEFAARVVGTRAQGLPHVGYGTSAARQRVGNAIGESYATLLSASWELDLWGRFRREREAATANLLATEQARLGVALTLVSAVVSGYVTLLDLDRRLQIAQATAQGRKSSVDVFQMRLDGGVVSDFEMMQVAAEYESAVSAIPDLQQAIAQQEHALSSLVGRNPGPIRRGGTLQDLAAPPVPAGLPSDLLARRPDILQAEQRLVAANALIGAARSLYFPRLSLTGSGGSVSNELDALFSGPARAWSFAGQLLGPIFAGGAIDSANRQAEALREQAVADYERTIQDAFRDVDDALVAIQSNDALVASLERRVAALQRAVGLARERYDNGYADYLDVLDTERSLFSAELSLTAARGDGYRSLVDLYRALGGDWVGHIAPLATEEPSVAIPLTRD